MTRHGFELARGRRMFMERSLRGGTPSCVVLIVGAGTASFMERELAALSGGGCLSPEAARRAAVIGWALESAAENAAGAHRGDGCAGAQDFGDAHTEVVAIAAEP